MPLSESKDSCSWFYFLTDAVDALHLRYPLSSIFTAVYKYSGAALTGPLAKVFPGQSFHSATA